MFLAKYRNPIHVHVTADRWETYGTSTFWSFFLHSLLEMLGGVEASVSPGWYDFNVTWRYFKMIVSLAPHVE